MKKIKKIKKIVLPHGNAKKIANVFGVTNVFVSYCLNFKTNSDLAKKIRHVAVKEYGGIEITNLK